MLARSLPIDGIVSRTSIVVAAYLLVHGLVVVGTRHGHVHRSRYRVVGSAAVRLRRCGWLPCTRSLVGVLQARSCVVHGMHTKKSLSSL